MTASLHQAAVLTS